MEPSFKRQAVFNEKDSTIILTVDKKIGKKSGRDVYQISLEHAEHGNIPKEMMKHICNTFNTILSKSDKEATELIKYIDKTSKNSCECKLFNKNRTSFIEFYSKNTPIKTIELKSDTIIKTNQAATETLHLSININKITPFSLSHKSSKIREKATSLALASKDFTLKALQKTKTMGEDFRQTAKEKFKGASEKWIAFTTKSYSKELAKEIKALAQIEKESVIDMNNPKHFLLVTNFLKKIQVINEENNSVKLFELFANKEFCDVFARLGNIANIKKINPIYQKLYNTKIEIIKDIYLIDENEITSITSNRLTTIIDYKNPEKTSKIFTNLFNLLKIEIEQSQDSSMIDEPDKLFEDLKMQMAIFVKYLIKNKNEYEENEFNEKDNRRKYFLKIAEFCLKHGDPDTAAVIKMALD